MALAYGNGFISSGLVHLVDASNMKSFPGAGTTWSDLSGNNRNGTLNNGLLWGAGNGGAISFDGSNDYVSFPNDIYSTLTTTTFSVWFYLNGTSTWQRVYDFGRGQTLNIFFTPNSGSGFPRFVINIGGGEQQLDDTTSVTTGVWYNFVVTLNGSQAQMYRNGALVATNTSFTYTPSSLGSTTQTWFGRSQYPDPYLNGKISQFAAYNRVLNSTEIQQNYNYLRNRFQSTSVFSPTQISGLQLWLDADDSRTLFTDTSGTTKATTDGTAVALWVDKSGSGYNGSQSTAGNRPALKLATQNGRNILRFDGNDRLDCGDVIEPATTITMFAVAKSSSTGQYCILGKGGFGNYYNAYCLFFNVSGTNTHVNFNTSTVGTGLSISSSNNVYYLVGGMYNGSSIYQWQNGSPATTTLTGNLVYNSDNLRIGMMPDGGNSFGLVGDIAEVIIYNVALTASQRIQVETYLNNKWGLWSSFTPTSISGLQLWLDSSDSGTLFQDSAGVIPAINDGDPVGYWKDKSGNNRNFTQATAANRPALKTSIQNSKNIIRFDGINDFIQPSGYAIGAQPVTIFTVFKTNGTGYHNIYDSSNSNPMMWIDGSGQIEFDITGYRSSSVLNTATLVSYVNASSGGIIAINGVTATSPYNVALSSSATTFFNRGGGQTYKGDFYEMLIYNSALSTAQRQQVETYLNQKWGVF